MKSRIIFSEVLHREETVGCSVYVFVLLILPNVLLNVVFSALHCNFSVNTLHHPHQCCSGNFVLEGLEVLHKL